MRRSTTPTFFSVTLAALSALGSASAQEADRGIWGEAIMAQPFDTRRFREVCVPAWLEEVTGCGYTLSGMDSKGREKAAALGVGISEIGFVDPFYAYYDSKLLKRRSPHVPPDRLGRDIAEYKRLGVRILGVYPPCLQGEAYELHPEWRRIAEKDGPIPQVDMKKYPHGGMLCLLGPYGDFFIDVLAEILETFPDVDAFSFDGLHYAGVCYCGNCRAAFRKDTGGEIPGVDMNDPAFRRYQHWADRRMEDLIVRMQTRLKRIKPGVALVTWTTNAGRFGHFLSIPRNMPARMNLLLDAPDQEFWLDETNRGATILPALANATIWAMTNHRVAFSEPYLMSHGNPYGKDSFPPHEVFRRMMLALTYGASPSIAVAQPENLRGAVEAGLLEVKRRKPWLGHKRPEPWAAIALSDNTRNFYGRDPGKVEDRYLAHVLGVFRAAVEEHLPVTIVNDWNLNSRDLSRYRVLVLPNTACLDAAQVAGIDAFVRAGGGLVASLDTSLFDEFGDPREGFALGAVLGVAHRGPPDFGNAGPARPAELDVNFAKAVGPDYWEKRKNVFDYRQGPGSFLDRGPGGYVGRDPVVFKGPAVRVATTGEGAAVLGTLGPRPGDGPADASAGIPAVVSRRHGKGKVVYLAAGLDAAYYLYGYPYHRLLLADAIRWAASAPPPVEVKAPMCVHANLMRQVKDGERLILHLYSDLNTTAFHALPDQDVPLREEAVPIADIRVRFDPAYLLRRVHLEPEGADLPVERTAAGSFVSVPRLEVHSMVVGELEPPPRP